MVCVVCACASEETPNVFGRVIGSACSKTLHYSLANPDDASRSCDYYVRLPDTADLLSPDSAMKNEKAIACARDDLVEGNDAPRCCCDDRVARDRLLVER